MKKVRRITWKETKVKVSIPDRESEALFSCSDKMNGNHGNIGPGIIPLLECKSKQHQLHIIFTVTMVTPNVHDIYCYHSNTDLT